jgi:hypothetical protein
MIGGSFQTPFTPCLVCLFRKDSECGVWTELGVATAGLLVQHLRPVARYPCWPGKQGNRICPIISGEAIFCNVTACKL